MLEQPTEIAGLVTQDNISTLCQTAASIPSATRLDALCEKFILKKGFHWGFSRDSKFKIQFIVISLCHKKEMLLLPAHSSVTEASAKIQVVLFFFCFFFSFLHWCVGAQAGCVTWRHHCWDARSQNRLNPRKGNHRKCVSFVSSSSYVTLLWAWPTVHIITALIYGKAGRAGPKHGMTGNHIVSHPPALCDSSGWDHTVSSCVES